MSTWSKILSGLLVLMVAAVVSLGVMLKNIDTAQFKAPLERMVERATGREFTLGGELNLVLSLNPKLSVTDVKLANASWGSQPEMMTMQRLDAEIDVLALLSRRLDVTYIILDGVELYLETDGQGLANWEFTPNTEQAKPEQAKTKQKLALSPDVRDVHLQNVKVYYLDGATGLSLDAELNHANFTADRLDSQMKGIIEATVNGVEMQASAELGSFAHIVGTEGDDFPVNLKISGPDISADLVAMVKHPGHGVFIDARVDGEVTNDAVLSQLIGIELPQVSPIIVRSKIDVAGTSITLNGLDAELGDSDVQGVVTVELGKLRPKVTAELRAKSLDINALAGISASTGSTPLTSPVFSDTPIILEGLDIVDADLSLDADKVSYDEMQFTGLKAQATLNDKKLAIKPLSFVYQKARIHAQANVDGTRQDPSYRLKGSVRDLNARTLATLAGEGELVDLGLDGDVLFISKGKSMQALAKGLRGHVKLIGRDGRIMDKAFVSKTEGIGSILPWASNKDANVISCFLAELPISDGTATAKTVVLDTSGVQVKVSGKIDLGAEAYDLNLNTEAKSTSLASFAVPMNIVGPLAEPEIKVTPGEVVVGTLGNIVKTPAKLIAGLLSDTVSLVETEEAKKAAKDKKDPCVQALSRGNTAAETSPKTSN